VVERLMDRLRLRKESLQHEASSRSTGTDTDDVFVSKRGVPSALVSVPLRYMHSPAEMVDLRDVENVIDLIEAFARSLKEEDRFHHDLLPSGDSPGRRCAKSELLVLPHDAECHLERLLVVQARIDVRAIRAVQVRSARPLRHRHTR
jgi:hypothetical protein